MRFNLRRIGTATALLAAARIGESPFLAEPVVASEYYRLMPSVFVFPKWSVFSKDNDKDVDDNQLDVKCKGIFLMYEPLPNQDSDAFAVGDFCH